MSMPLFDDCGSESPVWPASNTFAGSFREKSSPAESVKYLFSSASPHGLTVKQQGPLTMMNPYAMNFEPRPEAQQAPSSSVLNAFAMSFEPSDDSKREDAGGAVTQQQLNAFAMSFEPNDDEKREAGVAQQQLNAFAMSFEPKQNSPEETLLNSFAMSFAPASSRMVEPVLHGCGEEVIAEGEADSTPPSLVSMLPVMLPSRLLEELGHTGFSPKVAGGGAGMMPQRPAMAGSPAATAELPAWLQEVWKPRKRSISGSASPVSTGLDDEGSCCLADETGSGWSSAGSDTDSPPAEEPNPVWPMVGAIEQQQQQQQARRAQPSPADVAGRQKGREILNLLKDFGPGEQPLGGPGRQLAQELEFRNELLIQELQRWKAEHFRSSQRCSAEPVVQYKRGERKQARNIAAPANNPSVKDGKFRGAVNWQRLAQEAEAANTAVLTQLRRMGVEVRASRKGVF